MISTVPKRVILVTGGGNGIGLAIVNLLLSSHLAFVVAVDLNGAQLEPLLSKYPGSLEVIDGDVSDRNVSERAVTRALTAFGHLDAIILNAGILKPVGPVAETKVSDWKRLFDVNFFGLLHTIQVALPYLREQRGNIIMTSSGVSITPNAAWVAYACAKRAMNCLCAGLTVEEPSVMCVCITPGIVDTGIQKEVREEHKDNLPPQQYKFLNDLHQSGKLLNPEQPAATFVKFALKGIPKELAGELIAWDDTRIQ